MPDIRHTSLARQELRLYLSMTHRTSSRRVVSDGGPSDEERVEPHSLGQLLTIIDRGNAIC